MHLVVGLGNPGPKYAGNRHNVGFMVVDRLVDRWGVGPLRTKFDGAFVRAVRPHGDVVLLEPHTFMNRSGVSVQKAMAYFRVELARVLVVHDELDFPLGTVRVKQGGGAAGHNGLKSVTQMCGGPDYARVRVGIGRPPSGPPSPHVLSDFASAEKAALGVALERAEDAVDAVLERGIEVAMQDINQRAL